MNPHAEGTLEWHAWGLGYDAPLEAPRDIIRATWRRVLGQSWDTYADGDAGDRTADADILKAWDEGRRAAEQDSKPSLTLTTWTRVTRNERTGAEEIWGGFRTREAAESAGWGELLRVDERTESYHVGDLVEVQAFGYWRPGVVVGLGRTRVRVRYQRNLHGREDTRSFVAYYIRPASL